MPREIDRRRAERIARSHACGNCREYSFKRLVIRRAGAAHRTELKAAWVVDRVCGVCGFEEELALDPSGDIVYIS